ncbi:MAG: hypothetical protein KGM42_10120 [Hyphomicrobiales bacterium]|nr:hypothetical protein [Hyphomicrobiales bacterium]
MISPDDPPSEESPTEPKGNPIAWLIVRHWLLGGLLGIACAGALLVADPMGLRELLVRSDALVPGLAMLFVGFGTTFGGVVAATAVMFEKKDDDDKDGPPSGGLRGRLSSAQPALVPVRSARASVRSRY